MIHVKHLVLLKIPLHLPSCGNKFHRLIGLSSHPLKMEYLSQSHAIHVCFHSWLLWSTSEPNAHFLIHTTKITNPFQTNICRDWQGCWKGWTGHGKFPTALGLNRQDESRLPNSTVSLHLARHMRKTAGLHNSGELAGLPQGLVLETFPLQKVPVQRNP